MCWKILFGILETLKIGSFIKVLCWSYTWEPVIKNMQNSLSTEPCKMCCRAGGRWSPKRLPVGLVWFHHCTPHPVRVLKLEFWWSLPEVLGDLVEVACSLFCCPPFSQLTTPDCKVEPFVFAAFCLDFSSFLFQGSWQMGDLGVVRNLGVRVKSVLVLILHMLHLFDL